MTMLTVIAVDDEALALERIHALLGRIGDARLVARANSCRTGLQAIVRHTPDLLLLDVKLRDGTAFDLLAALPKGQAPMVAFVTAYQRYACRAFEVEALDYLLKPVEQDKLEEMLTKARRRLAMTTANQRAAELESIVERLRADSEAISPPSQYDQEIWIRQRGTDHTRLPIDAIDWISAQDDYACIYAQGREHLVRISLNRLSESLDPKRFIRIHRSTLVRADRIERIVLKNLGVREAVLTDGTRLAVGRVYARKLPWRSPRGT